MKNLILILLIFLGVVTNAQETVFFNTLNLKDGEIESGAGSLNACWMMDSDIERPRNTSNESRFTEMEIGSLRFPYGHLADNYLWDTPPYGSSPLTPAVASNTAIPGYFSNADNTWSWATNTDGTLRKDMDFDEYMILCKRQNIKPLLVVNALGHKYANGVSYEDLKINAIEWVKYVKVKGYEVDYWQIGNEIDHNGSTISSAEYVALYKDFVAAMKAEDPNIICGPGLLGNADILKTLLNSTPDLVDFASCHQYLHADPFTDYDEFVTYNGADVNKNIKTFQNAVNGSVKPNLPILITETNANGNWVDDKDINDLYKGLAWFDMLLTQQEYENVEYQFMWNSHSPWAGENGTAGPPNALTNTDENRITATGLAVKVFNTTAEEKIMIADDKVHGDTYSYGTYTPSSGNMTVYLMNKSSSSVPMTFKVWNYGISSDYERWVFSGTDPYDESPTFTELGKIEFKDFGFETILEPHALVVIKLKEDPSAPVSSGPSLSSNTFYLNHIGSGTRLIINEDNTDAVLTDTQVSTANAKWKLIDADDGYFYIENMENNFRLNGVSETISEESSIDVVNNSNEGDSVKWKLTAIGGNYFIDNKSFNTRLNAKNGRASVGSIDFVGTWQQWGLVAIDNSLSVYNYELTPIPVYPNPVASGVNIKINYMPEIHTNFLEFNILNVSGAKLISGKIDLLKNIKEYEIETKGLSSGIYFIRFFNEDVGINKVNKIIIN